jgi:hypothetical protein
MSPKYSCFLKHKRCMTNETDAATLLKGCELFGAAGTHSRQNIKCRSGSLPLARLAHASLRTAQATSVRLLKREMAPR